MATGILGARVMNTEYDDLEGISVMPGVSAEEWDDSHLTRIKVYTTHLLDDADAAKYGHHMIDCLTNGQSINSDLVTIMLNLAVSLRSPTDPSNRLLTGIPHQAGNVHILPLALPELIEDTQGNEDDGLVARIRATRGQEAEIEAQDGVEVEAAGVVGAAEDAQAQMENEPLGQQAAFYCYLSAFLMRIQSRNPQNVANTLKRAIERFKGWYEMDPVEAETINISVDALVKLKEVNARRPEITGTWVMWLAHTENTSVSLLTQSRGMLEYLGLQVFAYQGMHTLPQVLAIHQISKVPLRELLRELDSPMTRDGLRQIVGILRNHEITTTSTGRKTYFRYARVWDRKYFAALQSKACVPLFYVAAQVVKNLSPNSASDPTKAFALQNIGDQLKTGLTKVATRLTAALLQNTAIDARSGEIWEAFVEE
ncbi:TPA_asm: N [Ocimum alphacytorhabdovirus 1]|nr:TPA_asm: N [Ocimum alphacytorhabdovirus 1]